MNVFVLAHCRNAALFGATRLVFDSIRVGFPTAVVKVSLSHVPDGLENLLLEAIDNAGCLLDLRSGPTVHHNWIKHLLAEQNEPFFICDTDVVFWKECESWKLSGYLAGRFIQSFYEEWTKSAHKARLHTSLMYFDPVRVRSAMNEYYGQFPETPFGNLRPELIEGRVVTEGKFGIKLNYFFDTCALLYHAIGGQPFTEEQLDCFDHLNCGTYSDLIAPHLSVGKDIATNNQQLVSNPQLARGIWRQQERYYAYFKTI